MCIALCTTGHVPCSLVDLGKPVSKILIGYDIPESVVTDANPPPPPPPPPFPVNYDDLIDPRYEVGVLVLYQHNSSSEIDVQHSDALALVSFYLELH